MYFNDKYLFFAFLLKNSQSFLYLQGFLNLWDLKNMILMLFFDTFLKISIFYHFLSIFLIILSFYLKAF